MKCNATKQCNATKWPQPPLSLPNGILPPFRGQIERGIAYNGIMIAQLDQPIQRVHGAEASPSISKVLEAAACARPADITNALEEMLVAQGLRAVA